MIGIQRSSLFFLSGLLLASGSTIYSNFAMDRLTWISGATRYLDMENRLQIAPKRALSSEDQKVLDTAWQFIARNTRPETGLVDSVSGFPSTTLWDQGSYLFALVGARQLDVIDPSEFESRVQSLLQSFAKLPLFEGKLPNKAYDTRTLEMVNYQNEVTTTGIGWSALDVCRMLMAFRALERIAPEYGPDIRDLLSDWDLDAMAQNGELLGTGILDGETDLRQEGRLGYEQYAARAAALWGLDVSQASSADRILEWVEVQDVALPTDRRDAARFEAISPILSEPYLLQAFELGFDREAEIFAERIYQAQENRYTATGILTAVSEDHINQDPYFLYSSVYADGEPWAVVTEAGGAFPELRTLSTKAAFGWDALYNTAYTDQLIEAVGSLGDPEQGWPAGLFERDQAVNDVYTLNTNAVIIEAIHFAVFGPMWKI